MRWIGEHIWDFVSRFRNDVYLETLTENFDEFTVVIGNDNKLYKSTTPSEKSRIQVRNDEGSTIPAGSPLYSKGEIGGSDRILVGICVSSDPAKMPCIGIAEFEMNTTSTKDSFAITQGVYNTNISGFTGLSEGDILYVNGGVAPHLTQTKPTNGDLIQNVGIVLKTNGTICQGLLVSAIGRTNDVPWPLYVDHTNQRVGIGTSSPTVPFHVVGDARIQGNLTVNGTYTQIDTDVNTTEQWLVTNDGTGPAAVINQLGSQDIFDVQDDGTSVFYIEDGGQIGIGTTSPAAKLHTIPSGSIGWSSLGNAGILIGTDTGAGIGIDQNEIASKGDHLYLGTVTANKDLILRAGGATNRLVVKGDTGNIGIGTSSPGEKLEVAGNIKIGDSDVIKIGAGNDLQLFHDGTDSMIDNLTGNFYIRNQANDKDIIFICDNGSGGTETYFRVDGGSEKTIYAKPISLEDSVGLQLGTGTDAQIYHTGSEGTFINYTGNFRFIQSADNADISFHSDDGAGGVATYFTLDGSSATHDGSATTSMYTQWGDNSIISLGDAKDFSMYHTGTKTLLNNSTGNFEIRNSSDDSDILFQCDDGSGGTTTYFMLDGSTKTNKFSEKIEVYKADATANPRVSIGRSSGEAINFDVEDRTARIYHKQDETTGFHDLKITVDSDTSGTKDIKLGFRDADGSNESIKFTLDENGDVGIGTTTPSARLEVSSDSSYSSDINILSVSGTKTGGTAVTNVKGINVDIGSNDHVVGHDITNLYGAYINNNASGSSAQVINNWYGVYVPAVDADRVSNSVSAYFGDNVGIGTSSPEAKLDVESEILISGTDPILRMERGDGFNSDIIKVESSTDNIIIGDTSLDEMIFEVDDGEAMRIDNSGNVGIGTTNPSAKLEVTDGNVILRPNTSGAALTWKESDDGNIGGQLRSYGNRGDIYLYKDGSVGTDLSAGDGSFIPKIHVGGTSTASETLQVTGNIAVSGSVQRQISTTHHTFTFGVAGSASQDYWVPFIGSSEQAAPNVTHRTVAPYTGVLKKAIVHSTVAYGTSAQVRFHRINNGATKVFVNDNSTDDVTTNVTVDMSTAYAGASFNFTTGNTFSAGDQLGVSFVRDNTGLGDVAITLVWEYELF